ncbi:hypothetical protein F7725_021790, partial [Dissostichus mawsoni]
MVSSKDGDENGSSTAIHCPKCSFQHTEEAKVQQHIEKSLVAQREHKSTHMENGEYLCSECGRAFAWKSALVRHLKTHGEDADKVERSYKCPRCDLGFRCASYLNRHLQTHQEERVHTCNCGKSFAYRAALTAHQRIHQKERPHICTQCGKGFLYNGGLLSHMKIHSEEMPFMCSFCGKSFKRERNMKKHERCHTRENVFSCSQCDKSFVYKATYVQADGAVVASQGLVADLAVAQARQQAGRQHEVIEPPAHVLGAGVHHVDLLVCDIKVTTQHQGLLYVQLAQVRPEVHVPGFAVILSGGSSYSIGASGSFAFFVFFAEAI